MANRSFLNKLLKRWHSEMREPPRTSTHTYTHTRNAHTLLPLQTSHYTHPAHSLESLEIHRRYLVVVSEALTSTQRSAIPHPAGCRFGGGGGGSGGWGGGGVKSSFYELPRIIHQPAKKEWSGGWGGTAATDCNLKKSLNAKDRGSDVWGRGFLDQHHWATVA